MTLLRSYAILVLVGSGIGEPLESLFIASTFMRYVSSSFKVSVNNACSCNAGEVNSGSIFGTGYTKINLIPNKIKVAQGPTNECLLHVVVMLDGEYTYEYERCKVLLLIRGDRIDLLIYISHLLGEHEVPGDKVNGFEISG
jgi:hypothetical protein